MMPPAFDATVYQQRLRHHRVGRQIYLRSAQKDMVDCDGWAHPRNRGHPTDLFLGENVIGIDTGCGMGGFLTGVERFRKCTYTSRVGLVHCFRRAISE